MKKLAILATLLLATLQMLHAQDVIITRQSERIDAKILEVSESEIRYKKQNNPDGPTFVLSTTKVASILYANGEVQTFEAQKKASEDREEGKASSQKLYNGIETSLNPLLAIGLGEGSSTSFLVDAGFGRRFNNNFYWGMNVGGHFGSFSALTFGTTARAYFPLNSDLDVFIDVYAGPYTDFDNFGLMVRLMPGVQIPLSRNIDFRFSAGYMGEFVESRSANLLAIGASFAFHSATSTPADDDSPFDETAAAKPAKPEKPTFESGLQLNYEVSGYPLGVGVGVGYKFNKHLTAGIGFSGYFDDWDVYSHMGFYSYYWGYEIKGETVFEELLRFYARGTYRLTDNTFSPMARVDFGIKKVNHHLEEESDRTGIHTPFIAPSIGLSWRVTNNSYVELMCGIDMAFLGDVSADTEHYNYESDGSVFMKHFFATVGFSHTIDTKRVKHFFGLD